MDRLWPVWLYRSRAAIGILAGMSSTTLTQPAAASFDEARLTAFLDRALTDLSSGYAGVMISLGRRLGLYRAMAGAGLRHEGVFDAARPEEIGRAQNGKHRTAGRRQR